LAVSGLLVYTVIRFRVRPQDDGREPPQIYGSNQIELAWTVLPTLIVFVLILVTTRTIADVQNAPPPADALHVTVGVILLVLVLILSLRGDVRLAHAEHLEMIS